MKTITFLSFLLLFSLPLSAQTKIPEENGQEQQFSLLIVSAKEISSKAKEQKDIIHTNPKLKKQFNLHTYHVLPERIEPMNPGDEQLANNFNRFQRVLERGAAFQVILMDAQGNVIFQGNRPISAKNIRSLILKAEPR